MRRHNTYTRQSNYSTTRMDDRTPILRAEKLSKSFGTTVALDDVSVELYEHEIMGLVGQNGSGKSTFAKILTGVHLPNSGTILLNDQPVRPRNEMHAADLGLSIVYQDSIAIPDLTVYEWLNLGRKETMGHMFLNRSAMKNKAESILKDAGVDCNVGLRMADLDLHTRKMIEIARALSVVNKADRENPVVILDEPTSFLNPSQRQSLYDKLRVMKERASFILISHIIDEVFQISDRICVLRDGKAVKLFDKQGEHFDLGDVHTAIVGRELVQNRVKQEMGSEIVLRVQNLSRSRSYSHISFELHRGELLGIYGSAGSGASDVVKTIVGLIEADEGSVERDGRALRGGVANTVDSEVGYVSGNSEEQLFLFWPIRKNISIASLRKVVRKSSSILHILDLAQEREMSIRISKMLGIKAENIEVLVNNLSGGNRQKVALAKWIERGMKVLVMENPTVGLDVGAKFDFFNLLIQRKKEGYSVIWLSDDWNELNQYCDRLLAIQGGSLVSDRKG